MENQDAQLGEAAVKKGYITFSQLKECRDIQHKLTQMGLEPKPLLSILTEKKFLSKDQATEIETSLSGKAAEVTQPPGPGYEYAERAIKEGLITFEQMRECLDIQSKIRNLGYEPKPLEDILQQKGYLNEEQISALKSGTKKARIPPRVAQRIGDVAVRKKLITRQQLEGCLAEQAKARDRGETPKRIGEMLVDKGLLTPAQLDELVLIAAKAGAPFEIPGYQILTKIGVGGMGAVYQAKQTSIGRLAAIKILYPKFSKDKEYLERFLREARLLAKMSHPNIVSAIDAGQVRGTPYIIMEFVDGTSLSTLLDHKGRIPEADCVKLGIHIANALDHGHQHKLVHRDIKPQNVIIARDGLVKVCDFGVAKSTDGSDSSLTSTGLAVGTPYYMSPEACMGSNVDIRTDIYSLGATLYHLSTGTPPFDAPSPAQILAAHVNRPLESPKRRNPNLSDEFVQVVIRMMNKKPDRRYATPLEAAKDLERLLKSRRKTAAGLAPPDTGSLRVRRPARAGRRIQDTQLPPLLTYVIIFIAALGALVIVMKATRTRSPRPSVRSRHRAQTPAPARPRPAPAPKIDKPKPPPDLRQGEHETRLALLKKLRDRALSTPNAEAIVAPHEHILDSMSHFRGTEFEQLWRDELISHERALNQRADDLWDKVRERAEGRIELGEIEAAIEALERFPEHLRHIGKNKPTRAERSRLSMLGKLKGRIGVSLDEYRKRIDEAVAKGSLEEAWREALEASIAVGTEKTAALRNDLLVEQERVLRQPPLTTAAVERARSLLQPIKEDFALDGAFLTEIDALIGRLESEHAALLASGREWLTPEHTDALLEELDAALAKRDYRAAARRIIGFFTDKEIGPLLQLRGSQAEAILPLLEKPVRETEDAKALISLSARAVKAMAKEPTLPFFLRIWELGHVESLWLQGYHALLNPSQRIKRAVRKLKHPLLRGTTDLRVKPSKREGLAIDMVAVSGPNETGGTIPMYPGGPKALSPEDLAALVGAVPGGPGPEYKLRVALLHRSLGNGSSAASWARRIPPVAVPTDPALRAYVHALRSTDKKDGK